MQRKYDLSEFAPPKDKMKYDLSEFAPPEKNVKSEPGIILGDKNSDTSIISRVPNALGIVGSDLWDIAKKTPGAAVKAYGAIPEGIDYLKENVPNAGSLIANDPGLAAKNVLAGGVELAGKASRIPSALSKYLTHIGMIKPGTQEQLFPETFKEPELKSLMDKLIGEQKPGGEFLRGAARNADILYGLGKIAQVANPLKFTSKNLAKDVLKTEHKQITQHSKAYNSIWQEAEKSGFNKVPINNERLLKNLEPIEKYKTPKEYESLKKLIDEPSLQNAQKAQSDMGQIHRKLEEKSRTSSLNSEERALYDAAKDAEKHIEENMFKNPKGEINKSLQEKYNKLTKSYRKNVVPYKYNADIQAYKNQELLAKELIDRLKRGEFAAKKGGSHLRIGMKDKLQSTFLPYGLGAGSLYLIQKFLSEQSGSPLTSGEK